MSRWPSRKLQIGTIIVLAIGAAIQVFMPPLTKQSKAERLYLDGWFQSSVPKLEKALALDPGNSMYEQALVYRYPKDRLPKLLKTRRLGKDAQSLAAGLIYKQQSERTQDPKRKLALVDELIEADPTNAWPHYLKASILQEKGRLDECLAEIRRGNACGRIRLYSPAVPDPVLNANLSPILQPMFGDYAELRRLVRAIMDYAYLQLRERRAVDAADAMDDCMHMSVIVSSSEPTLTISVLVGLAMQKISTTSLEPVAKDFGMAHSLARIKRLDKGFDLALKACKTENSLSSLEKTASVFAISYAFLWAGGSAAGLLLVSFLGWILPAIRRKGQSAVNLGSWGEGWIARVSLIVTVPFMAVAVFVGSRTFGLDSPSEYMGPYALLIVLAQIIIVALGLRILHHRYDEDTGEKTGIFRFIFKSPANVKARTRKKLMVLLGGQLVFVGCLVLLAIILFKPLFGGHPWQIGRFNLLTISHEQATMRRVGDDLRKAYFYR